MGEIKKKKESEIRRIVRLQKFNTGDLVYTAKLPGMSQTFESHFDK